MQAGTVFLLKLLDDGVGNSEIGWFAEASVCFGFDVFGPNGCANNGSISAKISVEFSRLVPPAAVDVDPPTDLFFNLIQNQDLVEEKFRAKMVILKRKCRFRGFRHRWFQIFRSRSKIRKELEKSIFEFSKSIS